MSVRRVELHIERLVLDGLPALDQARVGAALQRELGLLLNQQGVPASLVRNSAHPGLRVPAVQVTPDGSAETLGRSIAGSVYRGLQR